MPVDMQTSWGRVVADPCHLDAVIVAYAKLARRRYYEALEQICARWSRMGTGLLPVPAMAAVELFIDPLFAGAPLPELEPRAPAIAGRATAALPLDEMEAHQRGLSREHAETDWTAAMRLGWKDSRDAWDARRRDALAALIDPVVLLARARAEADSPAGTA